MAVQSQNDYDWEAFMEDGQLAYSKGRYRDAEFLYKAALDMAMQAKCTFHTTIAGLLSLLGDLYAEQHKYELSEAFFRNALSILKCTSDSNHVDEAIALKRLSEVCHAQSKDGEAMDFAQQAKQLLAGRVTGFELLFRKRAARA